MKILHTLSIVFVLHIINTLITAIFPNKQNIIFVNIIANDNPFMHNNTMTNMNNE